MSPVESASTKKWLQDNNVDDEQMDDEVRNKNWYSVHNQPRYLNIYIHYQEKLYSNLFLNRSCHYK